MGTIKSEEIRKVERGGGGRRGGERGEGAEGGEGGRDTEKGGRVTYLTAAPFLLLDFETIKSLFDACDRSTSSYE